MKIFLSAVSGQFKACRDALRSDLSAVGAEVVVQEDFQQYGASLLEKLERYIGSCDRIIALVGDAYGFEPEETVRPIGQPRRSTRAGTGAGGRIHIENALFVWRIPRT
jgi:hypothetical protein